MTNVLTTNSLEQIEVERAKATFALANETALLTERSVIEYGQIAIRSVILANGGFATVILTFLGSARGFGTISDLMLVSIVIVAIGSGFGFVATLFAYFSQWGHLRIISRTAETSKPGARWERHAAVVCVCLGMMAFVIALICAGAALYKGLPVPTHSPTGSNSNGKRY